MQWLKKQGHHITIWTQRSNELEVTMKTKDWLKIQQIPYDRLLFDRPTNYINVDEAPSHARFYKHLGDMGIVASMYEEWKNDRQHEEKGSDTR